MKMIIMFTLLFSSMFAIDDIQTTPITTPVTSTPMDTTTSNNSASLSTYEIILKNESETINTNQFNITFRDETKPIQNFSNDSLTTLNTNYPTLIKHP